MTLTTTGLGVIANIYEPKTFKWCAVVLRFFQGQGDVLLQITGYSVITSIFSHDIMRYIGYIEISVGVGLGLGPTIGSVVYKYLYYQNTMYFFGALNFAALLICQCMIPSELNRTISEEELSEIDREYEELVSRNETVRTRPKITWCTMLGNKDVVFALITCFLGTFNVTFFSSFLANYLSQLGFDEDNVGFVLGA